MSYRASRVSRIRYQILRSAQDDYSSYLKSERQDRHMATLDWIVIAGYFGILLGLAWWVILKNKETSADYFLASHSLGWFVVGASIFASNIGSEHLVGLAGSGATEGV